MIPSSSPRFFTLLFSGAFVASLPGSAVAGVAVSGGLVFDTFSDAIGPSVEVQIPVDVLESPYPIFGVARVDTDLFGDFTSFSVRGGGRLQVFQKGPLDLAAGAGVQYLRSTFDTGGFFDSVSASAFGFYGEGTGHYAFAEGLGAFATASVSPLFFSEDFELQLAVVGGIRYTFGAPAPALYEGPEQPDPEDEFM
ncbi:MAG: hypothetical protein AAGJ56_09650 [Myxococcota bacterium]